jgi:hypothetical protein
MALNRRVYTDIPGTEALHAPPAVPQPHPFKATAAHAYWFIDGRMMDFALVVFGRNNPSPYTVSGRPLYVHLNGLAIVLLK